MKPTTPTTTTLAELQEKYGTLLDTAKALEIMPLDTWEIDGHLVIQGEAPYPMEKDLFWDKLKTFPDWHREVKADITVKNKDLYGVHRVRAGETLSQLADRHLGDARRHMEIFNFNKDVLSDPNLLKVGQRLKLPPRA